MKPQVIKDNIQAATYLSDAVASTLGPKGMNKLLVDNLGDSYVTSDGFTIIDKMEIKHPIAKLVAEVGKAINEEVGDGSKTAIILTGELLKEANELIEQGLHPTIIINGYKQARNNALRILKTKGKKTTEQDVEKIINTATRNKIITKLLLEAINDTKASEINIIKKKGRPEDSQIINGLAIDKEPVHPRMKRELKGAQVMITKKPIEVTNTETEAEITITDPKKLKDFLTDEVRVLKKIVQLIIDSGANLLICQKGIDERAQEYLAREGITAIRRVREKDIQQLLKATGAKLINDFNKITNDQLGFAGIVKVEKIGDERLTVLKACPGKTKTIIIKAATDQTIDEYEVMIKKTLKIIRKARAGSYVPGAGLTELMISNELLKDNIQGKERLAYESYAKAIKKVTSTLANNSGQDINELSPKDQGINPEGGLINPLKTGVLDLYDSKEQGINSATETAIMILRIDELLKGK